MFKNNLLYVCVRSLPGNGASMGDAPYWAGCARTFGSTSRRGWKATLGHHWSHLLPVLPAPLTPEVLPVPHPLSSRPVRGDQWKLRLTNSVSREVTEMQKRYLKKDWETQKNKKE